MVLVSRSWFAFVKLTLPRLNSISFHNFKHFYDERYAPRVFQCFNMIARLLRSTRQIEHLDLRDCPVSNTVLRTLNMNYLTHLNMRGTTHALLNLMQAVVEREPVALEYDTGLIAARTNLAQVTRCLVLALLGESHATLVRKYQVATTDTAVCGSFVRRGLIAPLDSTARTGDRSLARLECAGPVCLVDAPRHQHAQPGATHTFDRTSLPRTPREHT